MLRTPIKTCINIGSLNNLNPIIAPDLAPMNVVNTNPISNNNSFFIDSS